jgi:protoporphyrin/coproporphyrin ferrochelatase
MKGVLLVNLGSPDSPTVSDVRKYLREFLMDGRVLDAPYPVRFCIVNFAILPTRPKQSAEAYHQVWTPEGSPLVVTSERVQAELQNRFDIPISLAMRYQNPSIENAITELAMADVDELLLIPLFPHYAMSSFETAVERVKEVAAKYAPDMTVKVIAPYYDHPDYIRALVASAQPSLEQGYDHLLFSFHGIPERHLRKSDRTGCHCLKVANCCEVPSPAHATCYRAQCFKTMRAFAKGAGLKEGTYSIAFQSRLGRDPWLTPYTDEQLVHLALSGKKHVVVISPAFVSDCLETLEELGVRGREVFHEAGGKELRLVPCLNEHPLWLDALEKMIQQNLRLPQQQIAEVMCR